MNYLKKRYSRLLKSYAKRTKRFRIHNHDLHGTLLLDSTEPTSLVLFAGDEFEVEEYKFVANSIAAEQVDIFYDIGANFGGYSLLAARCGVRRIEAFEPNRKIFGVLAANITLNNFQNEIRAWNIAAGPVDTTAMLQIDPLATDVSSLAPDRMPQRWTYTTEQECIVRRIDQLLPANGKSIFVKMDVEGYECEALMGLAGLLKANKVRLLVEVLEHRDFEELATEKFGLKLEKRLGKNLVYRNYQV